MFAKPECHNVLQPELQSSEGCNTLLHEGLAKRSNTGKECYIVIVIYLQQTKLSCFSLFKEKKKLQFVHKL